MVKLKKALYGTVQASKLWYEKLISVLISCGYVMHPADGCVFIKTTDANEVIIAFHVDDLLILIIGIWQMSY